MSQGTEYAHITREDGETIKYIPFVPLTEDQKKFNQIVEDQAKFHSEYRKDFDSRRDWFKKHPSVPYPYPETSKSNQSFESSLNAISYDSDSDDSDDSDYSYDSADDSNYSDSFDPY